MTYALIFLILALTVFFVRRHVGLALLVSIISLIVMGWWSMDLAKLLFSLGLGRPLAHLQALIEIITFVLVAGTLLFRAHSHGRSMFWRIFDSAVFAISALTILGKSFSALFAIDATSLQIATFLAQNYKIILTLGLLYSLKEVLIDKHD